MNAQKEFKIKIDPLLKTQRQKEAWKKTSRM